LDSIEFRGTQRFQVLSRLGQGGMGVVYEVYDRERSTKVALKTLRRLNADGLLRFKNEFRALQDLQHPNLVTLGELFEDLGQWFFTMELVRGESLLRYVRPGYDEAQGDDPQAVSGVAGQERLGQAATLLTHASDLGLSDPSGQVSSDAGPSIRPRVVDGGGRFDEVRLRQALAQLCLGLSALHAAGKVHRDVKPSNIRVTAEGRVVLLDFGLVTDSAKEGAEDDAQVVGTTAYMAPEQAASKPVGPEADWYAVGVVVYAALTGRLPFTGARLEVLLNKQRFEPLPPSAIATVPSDLDVLCADLLRFDPAARPSGRAILRRLRADASLDSLGTPERSSSTNVGSLFVGRERDLATLWDALALTRCEAGVTILLQGESGVGKSALVKEFTTRLLAQDRHAVVLAGRCYERESVPYKAVDGIVDALSRYLSRKEARTRADVMLPAHTALLAQVFPVLRRVYAVAQLPQPESTALNPQELRSRVFAALRELLRRLAEEHPLVLCIDDLQWADADSLSLLGEVMLPPHEPSLLLLATVRQDRGRDTVPVGELSKSLPGDVRTWHLGHLPPEKAQELATLLLRRSGLEPGPYVRAIAMETDGHPLYIDELVRHTQLMGAGAREGLRLDEALWARIRTLDPPARGLLELVAVAGGPLAQDLAIHALAMEATEFSRVTAVLRMGHLLRTGGARRTDTIEPYHDRVRAAVLLNLPGEVKKGHHRRLALALDAAGGAEPETLAFNWQGAGELEHAAYHASVAGAQAASALAFERAARLFRMALELGPSPRTEPRVLQRKLADALANAGRGAEAAAIYLELSPSASTGDALELRRQAAELFLKSGHVDEGLEAIRIVLASVDLALPESMFWSLMSLAANRARARLRGTRFREREEHQISAKVLHQIDTCHSVGMGLAFVDPITGSMFQAKELVLALRAGEPYRVCRALASETIVSGAMGGASRQRTARLSARAEELAHKVPHAQALGFVYASSGIAALLEGRWRRALELCEKADAIYRERCVGVVWESDSVHMGYMPILFHLGEIREMCRRVSLYQHEAQERGDLFVTTCLRTGIGCMVPLAEDQPDRARENAMAAKREWSPKGPMVQSYLDLLAEAEIDLYQGEGLLAWTRLGDRWPALRRSLVLHVQQIRLFMTHVRARAALAAARSGGKDKRALCRAAASDAGRILGEGMPWSNPLAELVLGGHAMLCGNRADALEHLGAAAEQFDGQEMALHAAVARRRMGELGQGEAGRALVARADAWMVGQGIKNPARMSGMLAPGF
jgi:serine/threonine protein kinase/tetratricopeptide (TPR) repeat protein